MKRWAAFLFICLWANSFSQTSISPQFSELKGMEDQQENTHLFYRIYEEQIDLEGNGFKNNNIYHSDLNLEIDTLFLEDFWQFNSGIVSFNHINDFEFWNNNTSQFIYCGGEGFSMDNLSFIVRYDDGNTYFKTGSAKKIDISRQNDSLICVGVNVFESPGLIYTIISNDGGWNWVNISDLYQFTSLSPFNDLSYFAQEIQSGNLYKTINSGANFYLVDNYSSIFEIEYLYDLDAYHIYRTTADPISESYLLIISDNQGEPFSWQIKYSSDSEIFISIDESTSGTIYLTENKNIFVSTDFGDNFNLCKTLDRKIVGIYKKPNSNKLYAASKYKIYEITPDTFQVIKSLPPVDYYDWYPLSVGNLWTYENYYTENGVPYFAGYSWNWIERTLTLSNGEEYFENVWRYTNGDKDTVYLRLDSLEAILYAYDEGTSEDLLYEVLYSEIGDSICYEYNPVWNCQIVQSVEPFSIWGLNTFKKDLYPNYTGWICDHSLVKDIGLYHQGCGDLTTFYSNLIGCVIDGIIYGDTSAVGVEDKEMPIVSEFKLEQNYPNPFNPSTKIKFSIPASSLNPFSEGEGNFVTLKVYGVLGNEIATLVNEEIRLGLTAGEYEIEFDATGLPSGIYFYQLKAGSFVQTKKMILLK